MSTVTADAARLSTAKPAGLVLMEAIAAGEMPPPPAALLLGLEIDEVVEGRIAFGFVADERFSNYATTHGGILAAVADFAISTAVITQQPSGADVVTTNLAVTYLRPVPLGARYRCEGRVVHRGRTLVHAEATLTDAEGRELVRATASCHVRLPERTEEVIG
ncbi:MAG: PaaI family thioesterase [Acidimicrobiia bacterium]|jgi:uncharacterized protein (TIGR00369 family)